MVKGLNLPKGKNKLNEKCMCKSSFELEIWAFLHVN